MTKHLQHWQSHVHDYPEVHETPATATPNRTPAFYLSPDQAKYPLDRLTLRIVRHGPSTLCICLDRLLCSAVQRVCHADGRGDATVDKHRRAAAVGQFLLRQRHQAGGDFLRGLEQRRRNKTIIPPCSIAGAARGRRRWWRCQGMCRSCTSRDSTRCRACRRCHCNPLRHASNGPA